MDNTGKTIQNMETKRTIKTKRENVTVYVNSAIKILFAIWLCSFLVNKISSINVLYNTSSIGFKSFFSLLKQQSENVMMESGVWLYLISFPWCILNYQKIKGYILKQLQPFIERSNAKREANRLKAEQDIKREVTAKEWFGCACLFLSGMLLMDTFLYDSMTSFFKGNTQSQAMPKRVFFFLMLLLFHKYRSVVLVMFLISVCLYVVLWLTERRKLSK
ncbi:MAG: hypothetical protein UW80_C0040G0002 [Microgenomates group bacterium GW2011_GWC1_44_9]|nr:MAG: hypothetical protein UW80_C0040G0002 [Microgenomates group bacterium GW2011_GWC1_44_9]